MELEKLFCPNLDCPARGQIGQGNIGVHSQKEKRAICHVCDKSFATSSGTIFYRLRTEPQIVIWVLILLANGCPLQAAAIAFGLDERTIKNWWQRAGSHCEGVHNHLVGGSQLDLQHVQADEIKVKVQGGSLWMALAMMVSTRLWLGGAVSPKRDKSLIRRLVGKIRAIALCRPLLLAVDGLSSYVSAFQDAFRSPVHEGEPGRPRFFPGPILPSFKLSNSVRTASLASSGALFRVVTSRSSGYVRHRKEPWVSSIPPILNGSTPPSGNVCPG
jgi:transposase-like protein